MGENEQHAKQRWRRELRAAVDRLPPDVVARLSAVICARVVELAAFRKARHVVAYAAIGREVDPSSLVSAPWDAERPLYYPRMVGDDLEFVRAAPSSLSPGRGGVPEPPPGEVLHPNRAGVCFLVPALGFDARGTRLGRGAGCYDRALARYPEATRIGLAYAVQVVSRLPLESWDVAMHVVVTETQVHFVYPPGAVPASKENRP